MPIRWVINPVLETVEQIGPIPESEQEDLFAELKPGEFITFPLRQPKVNTLRDPGRSGFKTYKHSSVIGEGNWCLSFVSGVDMSGLDADPECESFLERDYEHGDNLLAQTPFALGWEPDQLQRILIRVILRGGDFRHLTEHTPLYHFVTILGRLILPGYPGPRGTWVQ